MILSFGTNGLGNTSTANLNFMWNCKVVVFGVKEILLED